MMIAVDFENNAETWWYEGGTDLWAELTGGEDLDVVTVEDAEAIEWLSRAARLPGWSDGPEYARHPVIVNPADEE